MASYNYIVSSVLRGHHVYKVIWTPFYWRAVTYYWRQKMEIWRTGSHQRRYCRGPHASLTVTCVMVFVWRGDSVTCKVTAHRKWGNGVEVPCNYTYTSSKRLINKLKKLVSLALSFSLALPLVSILPRLHVSKSAPPTVPRL